MAASPLHHQVTYTSNQSAQQEFQNQHNLEDPSQSIISYMKSLHEYTKSQLDTIESASAVFPRRTEAGQPATLKAESSVGSVEREVAAYMGVGVKDALQGVVNLGILTYFTIMIGMDPDGVVGL
ncbi:MAG: hypothetical protein Q9169_002543 [Polycauliona sp. 2 TL-2023]